MTRPRPATVARLLAAAASGVLLALSRPPVDAEWLDGELRELEQLADEGDTLEVVAKLGAIVREPKRDTPPAPGEAAPTESPTSVEITE